MKKLIRDYVAFNTWANDRICSEIILLNEEEFHHEMKSSFRNIRETLLHIWDAQDIWLERFEGTSPSKWPSASFSGSRDDLIDGLIASSEALEAKALEYNKQNLKKKVNYTTMKGNNGTSPLYQMLLHVVNHGTYHRGQLVTMLRELGKTAIPATDLIAFYRERTS
ncbi:MAG TPA: DinB family protein [Chitinophagales bacterium]|nr:DinB family protein [Chitinophagales bacterium]